jgi:uncharacterized protein YggE
MTLTLTPRRAAVLVITALAFILAYLLGTSHGGSSVAAAATGVPASSTGSTTGSPSGITVSGTGKVSGTPDTLLLDLTVSANGDSVSSALAAANSVESRVQKALLGGGVAAKDLKTSGLSIQPNYTYSKSGQPSVHGYQVTESVEAKLRDLGKAGGLISSATNAGGNAVRIDGVSLDLEDTGSLVSAARDNAFGEAKAKAEQYAKAAGRSLGSVTSISETVQAPTAKYLTPTMYAQDMASAGAPVPIQAGSQDVGVTVTVVFAFGV